MIVKGCYYKLKRENIKGQKSASHAHMEVGKKVRATIADLGGTMPELLPAEENIKEPRKRLRSADKKKLH